METTLNKRSGLAFSEKTKEIIINIICYLFIALFIYTATSKIMTMDAFKGILMASPLIGKTFGAIVGWLIPSFEIIISVMLIIPSLRKIGLYTFLILMIMFTAFLTYGILSGADLPCHCGGVINTMSWQQHIWLNIGFILLAIFSLFLYKK